jgi:hypothetical protein
MAKLVVFFDNCKSSVDSELIENDITLSGATILHSNVEYEYGTISFVIEVDNRDEYYKKFKQTKSYKKEI